MDFKTILTNEIAVAARKILLDLFARNQDRDQVMVLVEVMPPDFTNTKRAYRMNDNSTVIFRQWLHEAAEEVI